MLKKFINQSIPYGSQKIDNIIEFKNLANKLLEAYAG